MDWVEAFDDTNVLVRAQADGIENAAEAMLDFIERIRIYAREDSPYANSNFLVVAQNAANLYQENPGRYEQLIDAIALEAIWYDGDSGFDDWTQARGYNVPTDEIFAGWTAEVLGFLAPMRGQLPIFCCEYAQDTGGATYATDVYTSLALKRGFIPYCTRRSLAQLSTLPYPTGYTPTDY